MSRPFVKISLAANKCAFEVAFLVAIPSHDHQFLQCCKTYSTYILNDCSLRKHMGGLNGPKRAFAVLRDIPFLGQPFHLTMESIPCYSSDELLKIIGHVVPRSTWASGQQYATSPTVPVSYNVHTIVNISCIRHLVCTVLFRSTCGPSRHLLERKPRTFVPQS